VRIARIAAEAGVSAGLVHYHFDSRDALLEEAIEHSYERAGDMRLAALDEGRASAAQRLRAMIDQCLPSDRPLREDWVLWVELWLRAVREPGLRPVAARLYERYRRWMAALILAGTESGEFRSDVDVDAVADVAMALLDGTGVRALIDDPAMDVEAARALVAGRLATELGIEATALAE